LAGSDRHALELLDLGEAAGSVALSVEAETRAAGKTPDNDLFCRLLGGLTKG
jgi:hypothetical protein